MPRLLRLRMMPWLCERWPGHRAFPLYLQMGAAVLMDALRRMDDAEGIRQLLRHQSLSAADVQHQLDDVTLPNYLRSMLLDYVRRFGLFAETVRL